MYIDLSVLRVISFIINIIISYKYYLQPVIDWLRVSSSPWGKTTKKLLKKIKFKIIHFVIQKFTTKEYEKFTFSSLFPAFY